MSRLAFTVAIGCASCALLTRDRLLGLPRKTAIANADGLSIPLSIRSGENILDAVLVKPTTAAAKAGVLICHGIGETVGHWKATQKLLAKERVASLVFSYSGYGRSTGRIDAAQFERDAIAAFQLLEEFLPSVPISLLGFSLGSGIAAAIVPQVNAKRLVLCAAFTSFRKAACRLLPRRLAHLLPDIWTTQDALRSCAIPVLIVQGEADWLFPAQMARELADACVAPYELVLVPELAHNDPIYRPEASYWSLIADRVTDV